MSSPKQIDDGNWKLASQVGEPEIEYPFANEGDLSAWVITLRMQQDQAYFRALAPMTRMNTPLGPGYIVSGENTRGIGNGLVEWTRVIASVPRSRSKIPSGTTTLTIQVLHSEAPGGGGAATYSTEDFPFTRAAFCDYEYSLRPFEVIFAPRVLLINGGLVAVKIGNYGSFKAEDYVLTQDAEIGLYRGFIYYRKSTKALFGVIIPPD